MREFIVQLIIRLFSGKPWFFKVVQILTGFVAAVMLIPVWVKAYNDGGFFLPESWDEIIKQIVGYASSAALIIAQLPVTEDTKKKNKLND